MIEVTFDGVAVAGWYEEYRVFRDPTITRGTTFEKWIRQNKAKGRPLKLNFKAVNGRIRNHQNTWAKITCLDDIDAMKMRLSW